MAKKIKTRVAESLENSSHEDVTKYIEWLRTSIVDLSQALRRTIILALILMAAFELISGSPNTVITIGTFKLSGGQSIVTISIPAIVSILLYQAAADTDQLDTLQWVFTRVFAIWSREAELNDLDIWLLPAQSFYWDITGPQEKAGHRTWRYTIRNWTANFVGGIFLALVIGFQVQAYSVLYSKTRHYREFLLASICVAAFFSIAVIVQLIGFLWERESE